MPINTASAKEVFELEIRKNDLRTTMVQDKLSDPDIISIEIEISENLKMFQLNYHFQK